MSKFVFTMLAGSALAMGLLSPEPAHAFRRSDRVQAGKGTRHQVTFYSEAEADADFDRGHRSGYLCTYVDNKDGSWLVTWYKR
jgi:hypothetical protein